MLAPSTGQQTRSPRLGWGRRCIYDTATGKGAGSAAGGPDGKAPPPAEPGPLLAAERQFHDVLLLNLGLNVAYSAVGATMLGASHYGVDNVGRWRGFGTSLILQGAGLLVLDGIAFWASRGRLASLLDAGVQLSMRPAPTGLALTLQF